MVCCKRLPEGIYTPVSDQKICKSSKTISLSRRGRLLWKFGKQPQNPLTCFTLKTAMNRWSNWDSSWNCAHYLFKTLPQISEKIMLREAGEACRLLSLTQTWDALSMMKINKNLELLVYQILLFGNLPGHSIYSIYPYQPLPWNGRSRRCHWPNRQV